MKLTRLAFIMLAICLLPLGTLTIGPAPGQQPVVPAPAGPAPPLPPGYSADALTATYGPYFRPASVDHPSDKEQQLDRQAHDVVRQYGRTENRDEREKLREKLNDVLQQQFDAQQQRRKAEIEKIEAQIKKLREVMQKREDAKREIVRRRLDQLIQEAEGLGWTTSEPAPGLPLLPQTAAPLRGGFPRQN